ncbi:hypothetical protein CI238_00801 [Colletotrichum incanum]|uniref:Uncharacterized protein n=1 Tax=Colletotrichum incanum TaxID=1573173 RepID=A0A166RQJ6_COLIC|nr:hypothetical protein CI238_00801 [Colletotrichum incanum]
MRLVDNDSARCWYQPNKRRDNLKRQNHLKLRKLLFEMGENPLLQSQTQYANVRKARRSGGCTLLIVVVICTLVFLFFRNSRVGPHHNIHPSELSQHLIEQQPEQTDNHRELPPVEEIDAPGDRFYASDVLSELGKQAPDDSRPKIIQPSQQHGDVSGDADFYASDALWKAEKEAKLKRSRKNI